MKTSQDVRFRRVRPSKGKRGRGKGAVREFVGGGGGTPRGPSSKRAYLKCGRKLLCLAIEWVKVVGKGKQLGQKKRDIRVLAKSHPEGGQPAHYEGGDQ